MKRHTREEYIYIYTCILISSECIDRKTIETVDNRAIFVSSQVFFFLFARSIVYSWEFDPVINKDFLFYFSHGLAGSRIGIFIGK